jgi:hypothetical protein
MVSDDVNAKALVYTYKHPSKKIIVVEHLPSEEKRAANIAGSGAKRMTALKKTCSDPMMMQAFLLWR